MKRFEIGKPMGLAISTHCSVNLPRPLMVAIRHVTRESIAFATPNRPVRAIANCATRAPTGSEHSSRETKISGDPTDRMALLERPQTVS